MKDNEIVKYMYSWLNIIINELNFININKLCDTYIVRRSSLYHNNKYIHGSIITILHNMEDLSIMTLKLVIDKLVAYEMFQKIGQ